jgi:hypothetical protein
MTVRSKHLLPIILVVFILGIGGTMLFNLWQTTSSKIPATYTSGEFAGQYNPADIRGSYSFSDISDAFGVPVADLARAFAVENLENPAAFLTKQLEEMYGEVQNGEIGTDSIRWFTALYLGLPYVPEEDTLLPSPAVAVLRERLSETQLAELEARTVTLSDLMAAPETAEEEPLTHDEEAVGEVKGNTTFGDLESWGLSEEAIERAIGLPIGKPGVSVRDYCIEMGIEFSTVKSALQAAVDEIMGN